jgi:hypothetical protein
MASVYEKQGKYWLRYFDPVARAWKDRPTPLRAPKDARQARQLKHETTAAELRKKRKQPRRDERWQAWVDPYLLSRYGETKKRAVGVAQHGGELLQVERLPLGRLGQGVILK